MKTILLAFAAATLMAAPAYAQTITPPGPAPSPAPAVKATAAPKTKATPAPPKDEEITRAGISGVWEVAIQGSDGVVYTHFKIAQNGSVVTGQYLDDKGKKFPLAGSIDGKNVRVVVSLPDGTALVFSGSQDGGTDMVGTLSSAKDVLGFTAAYRPKYKWLDNLSPAPAGGGGIGSSGVP